VRQIGDAGDYVRSGRVSAAGVLLARFNSRSIKRPGWLQNATW